MSAALDEQFCTKGTIKTCRLFLKFWKKYFLKSILVDIFFVTWEYDTVELKQFFYDCSSVLERKHGTGLNLMGFKQKSKIINVDRNAALISICILNSKAVTYIKGRLPSLHINYDIYGWNYICVHYGFIYIPTCFS
jgi:hypothetical protein